MLSYRRCGQLTHYTMQFIIGKLWQYSSVNACEQVEESDLGVLQIVTKVMEHYDRINAVIQKVPKQLAAKGPQFRLYPSKVHEVNILPTREIVFLGPGVEQTL